MLKRLAFYLMLVVMLTLILRFAQAAAIITGKVGIETNLTETPSHTGKLIQALPEQTPVTIVQRQSSWTKVDSAG